MVNRFVESARGGRGLIPRRLRRFIAFTDTPLLCGGVVHFYLAGSLMTKVAPSPGMLVAYISPLCAATIL